MSSAIQDEPTLVELGRKVVHSGGRTLTYVRILPPMLAERPAPPAAPVIESSAAELAEDARRATLARENITLMGGVYVGHATTPSGTELQLYFGEGEARRQARVFIPFDLRQLDQIVELESAGTIYGYTILLSVADLAALPPAEHPAGLALFAADSPAAERPDYVFEGSAADAEAFDPILRGLEVLLAHAALHREELAAAFAARQAAAAERARLAALQPPLAPRDETIYFWKIPTSPAAPDTLAP